MTRASSTAAGGEEGTDDDLVDAAGGLVATKAGPLEHPVSNSAEASRPLICLLNLSSPAARPCPRSAR